METGFIYRWFDKLTNLYYIGKHRGSLNDGYISSSAIMLNEYYQRPGDFNREILWYSENTSDSELCQIEYKYLSEILNEEFYYGSNRKYYNQLNNGADPYTNSLVKYGKEELSLIKSNIMKGNTRGTGNKNKPKSSIHKQKIAERIKQLASDPNSLVGTAGGRKPKMPAEEVISIVLAHGFEEGSKIVGISKGALKGRYYSAKKRLTQK